MASKARDIADLGSNDVLETTATGLDVTGTVTADGLKSSDDIEIAVSSVFGQGLGYVGNTTSAGAGTMSLYDSATGGVTIDGFAPSYLANSGVVLKQGGVKGFHLKNNNNVEFYEDTGTTAKMVWSSSAEQLSIGSNLNSVTPLTINSSTASTGGAVAFLRQTGAADNGLVVDVTNTPSTYVADFRIGNSSKMRLDSSGNLLVGKTATSSNSAGMLIGSNGRFDAVRDSGYVGYFNRLGSDGDIALFAKDGATVGSIDSYAGIYTVYNSDNGSGFLGINGDRSYGWDSVRIYPMYDNTRDLGLLSKRFDDVYATNGTIQTSDRNEKQDIEVLDEAEQRVAQACKGLLRKFRWKDSVAEKGDDARIHFGIIAQDLRDAFTAEGLDAGQYAMFISSTWTDEETGEERTRLGVRYPELLAFIISAL